MSKVLKLGFRDANWYAGWASSQLEFMLTMVIASGERERFAKDFFGMLKDDVREAIEADASKLFTDEAVKQIVLRVIRKEK